MAKGVATQRLMTSEGIQAKPRPGDAGKGDGSWVRLRCDAWIPDTIVAVVAHDGAISDYTPRAAPQQADLRWALALRWSRRCCYTAKDARREFLVTTICD